MLNRKFIVGIIAIVLVLGGIFTFAFNGNDNRNKTPDPIEENNNNNNDNENDNENDNNQNNNEQLDEEVNRLVPVVNVDRTSPTITISGDNPVVVEVNTSYTDLGAKASDNEDGDLTESIVTVNTVDITKVGNYTVTYSVSDNAGNEATEVRTVYVVDEVLPLLSLKGDNPLRQEINTPFTDPGVIAVDNYDGDISGDVIATGNVDITTLGSYTLYYNVKDSENNSAVEITRTVIVEDTKAPLVSFDDDGNNIPSQAYSPIVNVIDNGTIVELKYLWLEEGSSAPTVTDFKSEFINNTAINSLVGVTGNYRLWVLAVDKGNNTTIKESKVFNLDNVAPKTTARIFRTTTRNTNGIYAKVGSTIYVKVSFNEELGTTPIVTIAGIPVTGYTLSTDTAGNLYYRYDLIITEDIANALVQNSDIPFSISGYKDRAGNEGLVHTSASNGDRIILDSEVPKIIVKDSSIETAPYFKSVSFKVTDINLKEVEVNGTVTDLSSSTEGNIDGIKIGENNGIAGENTIIARDKAGNTKPYTFYLDITPPSITYNGTVISSMWMDEIEVDKDATYIDINPFVVKDNLTSGELTPVSTTIRYQKSWNKTSGTYNHTVYKNKVDLGLPGIYRIDYNYKDQAGNTTYAVKWIPVKDTTVPTIEEKEGFNKLYNMGSDEPNWLEAVTMNDNSSLPLDYLIDEKPANFSMNIPGVYTIKLKSRETNVTNIYEAWDADTRTPLESTQITIDIEVIDHLPPTLILTGGDVDLVVGESFVEPGFTVSDNYALLTAANVVPEWDPELDINKEGTYKITYRVSDGRNTTTRSRNVIVHPLITEISVSSVPSSPTIYNGFQIKFNRDFVVSNPNQVKVTYEYSIDGGEYITANIKKYPGAVFDDLFYKQEERKYYTVFGAKIYTELEYNLTTFYDMWQIGNTKILPLGYGTIPKDSIVSMQEQEVQNRLRTAYNAIQSGKHVNIVTVLTFKLENGKTKVYKLSPVSYN